MVLLALAQQYQAAWPRADHFWREYAIVICGINRNESCSCTLISVRVSSGCRRHSMPCEMTIDLAVAMLREAARRGEFQLIWKCIVDHRLCSSAGRCGSGVGWRHYA